MKKLAILLVLICLSFAQNFDAKDPRVIIEEVRIYRLTKELDLTSEQAIKFFPKLHELRKIEKSFQEERMDLLFELTNLLRNKASNQEILKVIKQYQTAHIKKIEQEVENLKEMEKILTPVQQAKYLIFEERFAREIREIIKEVKKRHLRH